MDDILPIELIQGEDFRLDISWEDEHGNQVNITGYTAKMQFRKNAGDTKVYLEASTANDKIVADIPNNILKVTIPASEINALKVSYAEADFFATSPSNKTYKLFRARANIIKRITV